MSGRFQRGAGNGRVKKPPPASRLRIPLVALGLGPADFVVRINNRNFVSGYFEHAGIGADKAGALLKIMDNARKAEKGDGADFQERRDERKARNGRDGENEEG